MHADTAEVVTTALEHSCVGYGRGHLCVVCGVKIGRAEVAHEADGSRGLAVARQACFSAWHRESMAAREEPLRAAGAILGTLLETHDEYIVLNDHGRVVLTPAVRCPFPAGTRLQIVYTESEGTKVALSIERHHLG